MSLPAQSLDVRITWTCWIWHGGSCWISACNTSAPRTMMTPRPGGVMMMNVQTGRALVVLRSCTEASPERFPRRRTTVGVRLGLMRDLRAGSVSVYRSAGGHLIGVVYSGGLIRTCSFVPSETGPVHSLLMWLPFPGLRDNHEAAILVHAPAFTARENADSSSAAHTSPSRDRENTHFFQYLITLVLVVSRWGGRGGAQDRRSGDFNAVAVNR